MIPQRTVTLTMIIATPLVNISHTGKTKLPDIMNVAGSFKPSSSYSALDLVLVSHILTMNKQCQKMSAAESSTQKIVISSPKMTLSAPACWLEQVRILLSKDIFLSPFSKSSGCRGGSRSAIKMAAVNFSRNFTYFPHSLSNEPLSNSLTRVPHSADTQAENDSE